MSQAQEVNPDAIRRDVIKDMLKGSTARNPNSILGTVLADFNAQGNTELAVNKGEEIFILFEINDWAFVTAIGDSRRRGYIPLDYCDLVKDFYSFNPSVSTWQVVEYHRTPKQQPKPKIRARRVLFADEVQTKQQTNGYSTQSLPRDWGKSTTSPQPQVRRRNGYFYLESPSRQRVETTNSNITNTSHQLERPNSRKRYNSLPNMRNGLSSPAHTSPKQKNAFYSINETKDHEEKQKLRLASMQLYGSINNQINQQRKPVERTSSLNQSRSRPPLASAMKKPSNNNPSLFRASPQDSGTRWQSLETLHEANEVDDSPNAASKHPPQPAESSMKTTEKVREPGSASTKLRRSSSLNTHYPTRPSSTSSEKDRSIQRLIKRFQKKIQEADSITAKVNTSSPTENTQTPDLRIIPATPDAESNNDIKPQAHNPNPMVVETEVKSSIECEAQPIIGKGDTNHSATATTQSRSVESDNRILVPTETVETEVGTIQTPPNTSQTATPTITPTQPMETSENTLTKEAEIHSNTEQPMLDCRSHSTCCCCHHHHHEHHTRQAPADFIGGGNILHMLKYINTPPTPNLNSPGNDHSESGLGDTESIHSAGELQRQNSKTDSATETRNVSDGATQTTGSLEDIKMACMVERDNQTSPKDEAKPFQRNNQMRQSQKFTGSSFAAVSLDVIEQQASDELKEDNSERERLNLPSASNSSRRKLLTEEDYKQLQISNVDANHNLTRESNVDMDESEQLIRTKAGINQEIPQTSLSRYSEQSDDKGSRTIDTPADISNRKAAITDEVQKNKMKRSERRLSLPAGVNYSALLNPLTSLTATNQLPRSQSFRRKELDIQNNNTDHEEPLKMNYATLGDLTALDKEPEFGEKKKSWRSEFYQRHDATVADINKKHEDPWQTRKFRMKASGTTAKKNHAHKRRSTLSGIEEQYVKLEEARQQHNRPTYITDNLTTTPNRENNSQGKHNSINRWLDSIDLKETDCDTAAAESEYAEVIESDDNEEIII